MKKVLLLALFLTSGIILSSAQKIIKEATFDPSGKAKITNLKEVQIDKANNQITLYFLTKSTAKKMKAEVLYFDLDFNFIKSDNLEDDFEKIKEKYHLTFSLNFCPESKEPLLSVERVLFTDQTVFKKGYIENYFNWTTFLCDNRFHVEEKVKPKGDDGERIKLINYWSNNDIERYLRQVSYNTYGYYSITTTVQTGGMGSKWVMKGDAGDVVFMGIVIETKVAAKDPNLGKKYTIQRFGIANLSKISEKPLEFPVQAAPIFHKFMTNGNQAYIFNRIDGKYEFVEIDFDGNTVRRYVKDAPTDGMWVIDDLLELDNGDIVIAGNVAKAKINPSIPGFCIAPGYINSTLGSNAYKSRGYQVMIVGKNGIDNLTFNPIADFKTTFVMIDGEKKGKPYAGGPITVGDMFQTKSNDIIISGQKKNSKGQMLDIVAFYFDKTGKLVSNFATPMRKKNKYNQFTPTMQTFKNAIDTKDVYWTIYEVAGAKQYGETARTLYTPRIAKINSGGKKVETFIVPGGGDYYLDDNFPLNYVDDHTFIFIGSNRNGKELWFSKVHFD